MIESQDMVSKEEALQLTQTALKRLARLYHSFSETLCQELGEEQGLALIRKAIQAYGEDIGKEARQKAQSQDLPLIPENFTSDLPDIAWDTENVIVDGEPRIRVHSCPLASEWLSWGNPERARLYCFVDQAKMMGFNPKYEYIHVKNILDGDPYCELTIRQMQKPEEKKSDEEKEPDAKDTVSWVYGRYTRLDLMKMDPVCLRALFRERVHHTIEVLLYPILLGEKPVPPNFGRQPEIILEVWQQRGLPEDDPDFIWGKTYLELAAQVREKKILKWEEKLPEPFSASEMEIVRRLIWERRSIRNWIPGKAVPEELITQVLEAGRAAPCGCNLDIVRFIVLRNEEEAKMVWSDIPTPMDKCVLIVVCYDKRIYTTVGHDRLVPHNQMLDCAAAADHMCLMAHALGLGAVWLTRTQKTANVFKQKFGLPDYIEPALHIAVGWPAVAPKKSARMPLQEMLISK